MGWNKLLCANGVTVSPWREYKKKIGSTRPWDVLNHNAPKSSVFEAQERLDVCLECPSLIHATKQCKECGCFMALKVKLKEATCPLGKW
jgi:hypothetical protein